MTTEIAVLNKTAVALAADSAVTIPAVDANGHRNKVLNSANKLFSLSKFQPIGLMIYGNASLMGVPWETIVKAYRENLSDGSHDHVEDYQRDFLEFLDNLNLDPRVEQNYIDDATVMISNFVLSMVNEKIEHIFKTEKTVSEQDVEQVICNVLDEFAKNIKREAQDFNISSDFISSLESTHKESIQKTIRIYLEKLPLSDSSKQNLLASIILAAASGLGGYSGVVFAGFGNQDYFPSCCNVEIGSILSRKTIFKKGNKASIQHSSGSAIMPFAQRDDIYAFIEGIAPELEISIFESLSDIFVDKFPAELSTQLGNTLNLDTRQQSIIHDISRSMCLGAFDTVMEKCKEKRQDDYVDPVLRATSFLNKVELASMAETLVNLVSFRKQVSLAEETVGGPIDVAVISKGDGLVWIKRKHYFDPSLNHHFFSKYFRQGGSHV